MSFLILVVALSLAACDSSGNGGNGGGTTPPPKQKVPVMLEVAGDVTFVHDPVMTKEGGKYYLFSTGAGVPIRCSDNMEVWRNCGSVFTGAPAWARDAVPGVSDLWAPDVSYFNGEFHLYYSASTFGSNHSAIGLATSPTLDPGSADYGWTDHGMVVRSFRSNDYNAIDPNVVMDEEGVPWLSFGSFWTGIKQVRLDSLTGKPSEPTPTIHSLASRPPATPAIEAPFIIEHGDFYYLFVSFDACCRGAESTYNVRVGRSENVSGPYLDQGGKSLLEGGGTLLLSGTGQWKGTGHNGIFEEDGTTYLVYHAYDAFNNGVPNLRISPLVWDAGWPSVKME